MLYCSTAKKNFVILCLFFLTYACSYRVYFSQNIFMALISLDGNSWCYIFVLFFLSKSLSFLSYYYIYCHFTGKYMVYHCYFEDYYKCFLLVYTVAEFSGEFVRLLSWCFWFPSLTVFMEYVWDWTSFNIIKFIWYILLKKRIFRMKQNKTV